MSRRYRYSRSDVIASLQRQQGMTQAQLDAISNSLGKGAWEQWTTFREIGTYSYPWVPYADAAGNEPIYSVPRFRKNSANVVQLSGIVMANPYVNGASTQEMIHLPSGYRPLGGKRLIFMVTGYEGSYVYTRIDVEAGVGALVFMTGGRQMIGLDNITFVAES